MSVLICGLLLDTCGTVPHLLALIYCCLTVRKDNYYKNPKMFSRHADEKKKRGGS